MEYLLQRPVASIVSYAVFTLIAVLLFVKWPSTFVPEEDDGYFLAVVQLPPASSLERTQAVGKQINKILDSYPEVKDYIGCLLYTSQSFKRIRKNSRNGLGIVYVQRDACGGCFNKIPPQRQLDIRSRKKIIVCEYCGRIMIDPELAGITPEQKVEVVKEKPVRAKRKIVHIRCV